MTNKAINQTVSGLTNEQLAQLVLKESALAWVNELKLKLDETTRFHLDRNHKYQMEPLHDTPQRSCAKKGSQIGWTTNEVFTSLHGLVYGKYKGVGYLFPTSKDAEEFTKYCFDPIIAANPEISRHVRNIDAASIKQIGKGTLFIRGARPSSHKAGGEKETSTQLKTFPADRMVFDECDEMKESMIAMGLERMGHSRIKEEVYLSTPSIPDFGIDAMYDSSDQRVWMIKCTHCGKETCLELEFPHCLKDYTDGRVIRTCMNSRCGREIFPSNGHWVALYPDKAQEMVGRWISRLNSDFEQPKDILGAFNDPRAYRTTLQEVYNSKLGMAYVAAENRLTVNDVLRCCNLDPMLAKHDGPSAIGVDVGKDLHVVIGVRPTGHLLRVIKTIKLIDAENSTVFQELHDIAKRFNCKCMVIDAEPETHKVREFQKAESYPIWMCSYQKGKKKGPTAWMENGNEIYGNRTELLDASHDLVATQGKLEIPRKNDEVIKFARQLTNIARVLDEDKETGSKTYRYKKLGSKEDHYRHALTYCQLAAKRVGKESDKKTIDRYWDWKARRVAARRAA